MINALLMLLTLSAVHVNGKKHLHNSKLFICLFIFYQHILLHTTKQTEGNRQWHTNEVQRETKEWF